MIEFIVMLTPFVLGFFILRALYRWGQQRGRIQSAVSSVTPAKSNNATSPTSRRGFIDHGSYDDWEGTFWDVDQPRSVSALLRFSYIDGKGQGSRRLFQVDRAGRYENHFLLIGFCHLRRATRTFRTDRITECYDEESGDLILNIHDFISSRYAASPDAAGDEFLKSESDVICTLVYVAKADNRMLAAEKRIIKETCLAIAQNSKLTDEGIDRILKLFQPPTLGDFEHAACRLSRRGPETRSLVLESAKRIVGTQAKVHPNEKDALGLLEKLLCSPPESTKGSTV